MKEKHVRLIRKRERSPRLPYIPGPHRPNPEEILRSVGPSWAAMTSYQRQRYPAIGRRALDRLWRPQGPPGG